jgi:hypothetical protein
MEAELPQFWFRRDLLQAMMNPAELAEPRLGSRLLRSPKPEALRQPHPPAAIAFPQDPCKPCRPFPFFALPTELRLLVYEFLFSPEDPAGRYTLFPCSSTTLEPLLTCRRIYLEARDTAFRCTVFDVEWTGRLICAHRLRALESSVLSNIRHVAIPTTPGQLYEKLQPLRYHLDRMRQPYLSLDSLTIVLQNPVPQQASSQMNSLIIREMNMILTTIWYFKNVRKVCVLNMLLREFLKEHPSELGKWTRRTEQESDSSQVPWSFELTTFFDYSLGPRRHR